MNTGFLGSAVATVLTVYGIETNILKLFLELMIMLQQYLPFTVLKRHLLSLPMLDLLSCNSTYRLRY